MATATNGSVGFRLLDLDIQDFRGIDRLHLDFRDETDEPIPLIVLAGDNGCGKTAVLEAILLLLARDDLLPQDAAPLKEQIRFGAENFRLQANLRAGDLDGRKSTKSTRIYVPPVEDGTLFPSFGYWGVSSIPLWGKPAWPMIKGWSHNYDGRQVPQLEYFSARREPVRLGHTPDKVDGQERDEGQRLANLKRLLINSFYRRNRRGSTTEKGGSPFERLQRFWTRFSTKNQTLDVLPASNNPGSGDEVVLRDATQPIPEDITSLEQARELSATRSDIPKLLTLDRLSSGQVALFAFAGPLVFSDRPADFVLIDEPEQHMHTSWQRLIIPALRELSPTSQFIVATQSEEILSQALSYERFILIGDADPRASLSSEGGSNEAQS